MSVKMNEAMYVWVRTESIPEIRIKGKRQKIENKDKESLNEI